MTQVGYLGVVLPDSDFYQGYFIDDGFADNARDALRGIRADEARLTGAITWTPVPGAADADQPIVGAMSATIVDTVLAGGNQISQINRLLLGTCACAIRELTGRGYFWIEGRGDENGVSTTITMLDVATIDAARHAINALPTVMAIQRRLLARLIKRTSKPS